MNPHKIVKRLVLTGVPVKVKFKKPIFEDDYVETGMLGYLIGIEKRDECFKLYFDNGEFFEHNVALMGEVYYPNIHTNKLEDSDKRKFFTALEAGYYSDRYEVYYGESKYHDKSIDELSEYLEFL